MWDATTGQDLLSLKGHTFGVSSVAYSPDGKRISGQCSYGKVLTWDATSGQLLSDAAPVPLQNQTQATSPDGSQRAIIENGDLKIVLIEEHKRQQALDRAFLERLARPDPAYHRHKADLYETSGRL